MDTNEKKSHSKVCSSIPECLCPSVLIALLSSENESTPSSSLSNSWNTSLYSNTFSSDSCSSSYKQFSSTSYDRCSLFYSPYPPTQSAPLCQVCQLVPWFSSHSEQCGTNITYRAQVFHQQVFTTLYILSWSQQRFTFFTVQSRAILNSEVSLSVGCLVLRQISKQAIFV